MIFNPAPSTTERETIARRMTSGVARGKVHDAWRTRSWGTLEYAKEGGGEARIIFDGAGTQAAAEFSKKDHKYNELFEKVRGHIEGACSYCAVGSPMTIAFKPQREKFLVLNGGPSFPFSNAVSLLVNFESQEEIDHYWEKLAADGGEQLECGWLKASLGCRGRSCRARFGSGCGAKIPRACTGHGHTLAEEKAGPGRAGTRRRLTCSLRKPCKSFGHCRGYT